MQRAQRTEIKNLIVFLAVILLVTALTWFTLEAFDKKPVKDMNIKPKTSKNLAVDQDSEVEKVPVADENFEVYQFKDPFLPLTKDNAPAENVPPASSSSTSGGETQSSQSAPNTAISSANSPQVAGIRSVGNRTAATVIINGKKTNVVEGQMVQGYKIVDIDADANAVELLYGDQKLIVNQTK